ncbi:GNAT family N-acetyltransferase [Pseudovibrio ascidiaceicola]|uniref:GNAT family N-acetyltransferase n=1 Tax=Pseudovibrio ascidiaceicola TaxID=285279 RepID=UPI003D35FD26
MQADVITSNELASVRLSSATKALQNPSVRVLQSAVEVAEFQQQWHQLEQASKGNLVFQSYAWIIAMLENPASVQSARIFAVYDQQSLIAVLPLRIEKQKSLKALTGLGEPFQQYSEMLLDPAYSPADVLDHLKPYLQKAGADVIHLRQIREGGALYEYASTYFTEVGETDGAPWLELNQWSSFEDYLTSISARSRKTIRNQRNRLHKSAGLTHRVVRQEDSELETLLLRTLNGRENWVEAMGYSSRALEGDGLQNFLLSLSKGTAKGCELIAFELKHGDRPISTEWGFLFEGCYSAYMADWNPDYEQSSPGKLHQMDVIEACFALGIDKVDFLKPASRYKMTWTSQVASVFDAVSPLSVKGQLYASLWLKNLRPLAKRIVLAMPKGPRALLMSSVKKIRG